MKCDKCWFCTHIGSGIYASYPVKYCKHTKEYKLPRVVIGVDETGVKQRQLNLRDIRDAKIWHEVGCNIHPSTVAKAKREFIKDLEGAQ